MDFSFLSWIESAIKMMERFKQMKEVGPQTQSLLSTTMHVSRSVQHARMLQQQKSALLNEVEKDWTDNVIRDAEAAIVVVVGLIDRALIDMQTSASGKISLRTRLQMALIDPRTVTIYLSRMSITSQSVNTALGVLSHREPRGGQPAGEMTRRRDKNGVDDGAMDRGAAAALSHDGSIFLQWRTSPAINGRGEGEQQVDTRRRPHPDDDNDRFAVDSVELEDASSPPAVDVMDVLDRPTVVVRKPTPPLDEDDDADGQHVGRHVSVTGPSVHQAGATMDPDRLRAIGTGEPQPQKTGENWPRIISGTSGPPREKGSDARPVGIQRHRSWLEFHGGLLRDGNCSDRFVTSAGGSVGRRSAGQLACLSNRSTGSLE